MGARGWRKTQRFLAITGQLHTQLRTAVSWCPEQLCHDAQNSYVIMHRTAVSWCTSPVQAQATPNSREGGGAHKVTPLAVMLLAIVKLCDRESRFSLKVWRLMVQHTSADGYTSNSILGGGGKQRGRERGKERTQIWVCKDKDMDLRGPVRRAGYHQNASYKVLN